MKYWKGKNKTSKENNFGVMDNNGFVPNSIKISKYQYNKFIRNEKLKIKPSILKEQYIKLILIEDKINFIAKYLELI